VGLPHILSRGKGRGGQTALFKKVLCKYFTSFEAGRCGVRAEYYPPAGAKRVHYACYERRLGAHDREVGINAFGNTPPVLPAWMRAEIARWQEVAKAANLKAD